MVFDTWYCYAQSCFSCAAGKTSSEPGKECRECPYEHVLQNKTCHPCVDIPLGKTLKRFAEVCSELICKQGQSTYTTDCVVEFEEEGARNCRQDGFGWNHLQLNSCDVCSINYQSIRIQADATSSFNVCAECGHNLFTRDTGMSACTRCPLYHTRPKGSPACNLCVAGTSVVFSLNRVRKCTEHSEVCPRFCLSNVSIILSRVCVFSVCCTHKCTHHFTQVSDYCHELL